MTSRSQLRREAVQRGHEAERQPMNLPDLPDDLAEAADAMKLAIARHLYDGWREVSQTDVLQMLSMLRTLADSAGELPPLHRRYQ